MLKHEILNILSVEDWMKFKEFVKDRPNREILDNEMVKHIDYYGKDLYEFMVAQGIR